MGGDVVLKPTAHKHPLPAPFSTYMRGADVMCWKRMKEFCKIMCDLKVEKCSPSQQKNILIYLFRCLHGPTYEPKPQAKPKAHISCKHQDIHWIRIYKYATFYNTPKFYTMLSAKSICEWSGTKVPEGWKGAGSWVKELHECDAMRAYLNRVIYAISFIYYLWHSICCASMLYFYLLRIEYFVNMKFLG